MARHLCEYGHEAARHSGDDTARRMQILNVDFDFPGHRFQPEVTASRRVASILISSAFAPPPHSSGQPRMYARWPLESPLSGSDQERPPSTSSPHLAARREIARERALPAVEARRRAGFGCRLGLHRHACQERPVAHRRLPRQSAARGRRPWRHPGCLAPPLSTPPRHGGTRSSDPRPARYSSGGAGSSSG